MKARSLRLDGRREVGILLSGNVAPTGIAEVEYIFDSAYWTLLAEVSGQEPPHVFRQGETQGTGPGSCPAMELRVERDLGARHHDGTMIAWGYSIRQSNLWANRLSWLGQVATEGGAAGIHPSGNRGPRAWVAKRWAPGIRQSAIDGEEE